MTGSAGRIIGIAGLAGFAWAVAVASVGAQPPSGAPAEAVSARAVLDRYCVACHNARTLTAGLALDTVDPTHVGDDAAVWEKVLRKLRTATMPPAPRPRPDAATYAALATYLETALDRAAETAPNPGRPAVQRLNRAEYVNAVRDILALDVDAQTLLPADESGYGFDNIGDVLTVSPGLLERYLLAAAKISRQAVGDPTLRPTTALYRTSPLLAQDGRVSEDLPFGSRGGLAVRHHFPLDAEYVVRVALRGRARAGHALEVRLDRERVGRFDLGERAPLEVPRPRRGRHAAARGLVRRGAGAVTAPSTGARRRPPSPASRSRSIRNAPSVGARRGRRAVLGAHPDRHAEPARHLHLLSRRCGGRGRLRRAHRRRPRATRLPASGDRDRHRPPARGLRGGTAGGRRFRGRRTVGHRGAPRLAEVPVPGRGGPRGRRARRAVPARRSRPRVAALVLPVEQHSRRRARRPRRPRTAARAGRHRESGPPHARRPPRAVADRELRGTVALPAQPARHGPRPGPASPTSTTTCGGRSGRRPSCS